MLKPIDVQIRWNYRHHNNYSLSSSIRCFSIAWCYLGYGKPFGFLFSISRYRELFPDIGNLNSRYREINFRYREIINFPISGNDFRISGIDFPISGNVFDFPISGNQFPISENRHPTEAGHFATLQHRPTTPPINNGPRSNTGPIGERHYDFSKSQCLYIHICKTRSVQPTIIIQPIISFRNTEIFGAELMSLMILTRTQHWGNWHYYM